MATRLLASGEFSGGAFPGDGPVRRLGHREIESIITDLLDYARETRLDSQDYPLGLILGPVVASAIAEGEARGCVTAQGLEEDLVATVDGPRLRQVFANVVKNALEATDRHPEGYVAVRLYQRQSAAVVEVADNGVGIARSPGQGLPAVLHHQADRAPGSAWRSSRRSWICTVARSRSRAALARARRSAGHPAATRPAVTGVG